MKSLEIINSCLYIIDYNRRQMSEEELLMNIDGYFVKENELQQIKQDLEVLEIIYKKNVDVKNLRIYIKTFSHDKDLLSTYNVGLDEEYRLTMKELQKLKQWLEGNEE